jgi:hypothetical protein
VVFRHPPEKYESEFVRLDIIPTRKGKIKNVPNHQPGSLVSGSTKLLTSVEALHEWHEEKHMVFKDINV